LEKAMSETNLEQVREDLAVMREALGIRLPFEWAHVWACVALSVVGMGVAVITSGTNLTVSPVVLGLSARWAYIGLLIVPVSLVLIFMTLVARSRKQDFPLFWRENRQAWAVAAVAVPLFIGFAAWIVRSGLSAGTLTASTFFVAGLYPLMSAVADRSKRYMLGWAVSTILAGAVAPLASYESAGILAGGWLILGGLSTAVIMACQLRTEGKHVAH
jgi:hypothetical protein